MREQGAAFGWATLDDFSSADHTSIGAPRMVIADDSMGGKSHLESEVADGVISASGEIKPARGQLRTPDPNCRRAPEPMGGPGLRGRLLWQASRPRAVAH